MSSWAAIARAAPPAEQSEEKPKDLKRRAVVVDANAIIGEEGLWQLPFGSERIVTIPEVLKEVRDKRSRSFLESLPIPIEAEEPSEESVQAGLFHILYAFFCMHRTCTIPLTSHKTVSSLLFSLYSNAIRSVHR